jgi:hypothetical protein
MPLTKSQRRKINQANAKLSTGPRSDDGKQRSRQNALKHGLRAQSLALPNEEPCQNQAKLDEWLDFYKPRTPGERDLIEQAVTASIQLKRCQRFHHATVSEQVENAAQDWDEANAEEVARLIAALETDPAEAVEGLKLTADGVAWLLGRWARLRAIFEAEGRWTEPDRDEAIRLTGSSPEPQPEAIEAFLIRFFNLQTHENPDPEARAWLLRPEYVPPTIRGRVESYHPGPEEARARLRMIIDRTVYALKRLEATAAESDAAERQAATDRALMIADPTVARLHLRYQTSSEMAFHRSYKQLLKSLSEPVEAEVPNEPNGLEMSSEEDDEETTYDDDEEDESESDDEECCDSWAVSNDEEETTLDDLPLDVSSEAYRTILEALKVSA